MENQKAFLQEIKKLVLSFDEKAEVILYGSRARGDYKEESDWDILILTSRKLELDEQNDLRDSIYDIELKHIQAVSAIILDKETWDYWEISPFNRNVASDGIYI